jgi:transcriptional regulator with XRE-family HTH domain
MEQIGQTLREARERLGLTLEEAERATRIRSHHLAALEAGNLDALPSPVQARGFLKNYAEFLGLDPNAVLLRYAEGLQTRRARPRVSASPPPPTPAPRLPVRRPRWFSADLVIAVVVALAILVVLVWGLGRVMAAFRERSEAQLPGATGRAPTVSPSPSSTPEMLAIPLGPTDVPIAVETTPTPTLPSIQVVGGGVDVRILVELSAWVSVKVDGRETFRGRVDPGDHLEYFGQQSVEVTTGNGGGLRIFYNGEDQGTLGGLGEVVIRLWGLSGPMTPTATLTRTPTVTPRVSSTPLPTATVQPAAGG